MCGAGYDQNGGDVSTHCFKILIIDIQDLQMELVITVLEKMSQHIVLRFSL